MKSLNAWGIAMSNSWVISAPVWGQRYLDVFFSSTFPALKRAVELLGKPVDLVVHTNRPDLFPKSSGLINVITLGVPPDDLSFMSLSASHRHVLRNANLRQRICLLTSDLHISPQTLLFCDSKLGKDGINLICIASMRCYEEELPPELSDGRSLLSWGWDHRHKITHESTWPEGCSYDVWRMYFTLGENVSSRVCLPHPLALIKDHRNIRFSPTIDVNVMANYRFPEIYVVTDPDEAAMIELSPKDKHFETTAKMRERLFTKGPSIPQLVKLHNPHQRFMVQKRIVIKGKDVSCGEESVVQRLLHGV